jgi:hypothetical protein
MARALEYRFGGQSHLYFERQALQPDGTWMVIAGLESDKLDIALASRELTDVTCRSKGKDIEFWASVSARKYFDSLPVSDYVIAIKSDNSIEFDTIVITGID